MITKEDLHRELYIKIFRAMAFLESYDGRTNTDEVAEYVSRNVMAPINQDSRANLRDMSMVQATNEIDGKNN